MSIIAPGAPVVSQEGTNYVMSWTPLSGTEVSGPIRYQPSYWVESLHQYYTLPWQSATTAVIEIPEDFYEKEAGFDVEAMFSGQLVLSETTYFTAHRGTQTKPGDPVVSQRGSDFYVEWTPAIGSGGTGEVTYIVIYGEEGEYINTGTDTYLLFPISDFFYEKSVRFRVIAFYSGWEVSCEHATFFTPRLGCMRYYDGKKWVECFPYYRVHDTWVQCVPSYYHDKKWTECN